MNERKRRQGVNHETHEIHEKEKPPEGLVRFRVVREISWLMNSGPKKEDGASWVRPVLRD
jgi:hypothetical protein